MKAFTSVATVGATDKVDKSRLSFNLIRSTNPQLTNASSAWVHNTLITLSSRQQNGLALRRLATITPSANSSVLAVFGFRMIGTQIMDLLGSSGLLQSSTAPLNLDEFSRLKTKLRHYHLRVSIVFHTV